jgi:hypothetical protein
MQVQNLLPLFASKDCQPQKESICDSLKKLLPAHRFESSFVILYNFCEEFWFMFSARWATSAMMMRIQEIPETNCSPWFFNNQQFACFFVRDFGKLNAPCFWHQLFVLTKLNNIKNSPSNRLNGNSLELQCYNAGKTHQLVSKNTLQFESHDRPWKVRKPWKKHLSSSIICCQCYNMNMCLMNITTKECREGAWRKSDMLRHYILGCHLSSTNSWATAPLWKDDVDICFLLLN